MCSRVFKHFKHVKRVFKHFKHFLEMTLLTRMGMTSSYCYFHFGVKENLMPKRRFVIKTEKLRHLAYIYIYINIYIGSYVKTFAD